MSFAESHLGKIRAKWGSEPILFPGVFAVVLDAAGDKVLLGWRDQLNGWSAFGGSMELGESILQTLHRETAEETGAEVSSYRFFGMMTAPEYTVVYPHGDVTQSVSALFEVQLVHYDVIMDEEHSRFEWFPVASLPEDMTSQTRALMKKYIEFRHNGAIQID